MCAVTPVDNRQSMHRRIEARLDVLSQKQRAVAQYILNNPTTVLFATATEVAQRVCVDPATVIRFTQRLGFHGYPDFQERLRAEYPALVTPKEQFLPTQVQAATGPLSAVGERVRALTYANVAQTFNQLDWQLLDTVAAQALAARRVVVVAGGLSTVLGLHVQRVLQLVQIPVQLLVDWYDLLYDAVNIDPADLVFGITALRYSKVTVEALALAHAAGAHTALLTDAPFAPGVTFAETRLLFSPKAVAEYFSPAAGAIVIDCLSACLAQRAPERFQRAVERQIQLGVAYNLSYW